jgi:hypothetical protein
VSVSALVAVGVASGFIESGVGSSPVASLASLSPRCGHRIVTGIIARALGVRAAKTRAIGRQEQQERG